MNITAVLITYVPRYLQGSTTPRSLVGTYRSLEICRYASSDFVILGDDVSVLKKQCPADNKPLTCLKEDRGDVAFVSSKYLSIKLL